MLDMCRAKLKGKTGAHGPSGGAQTLPYCTRSGILQTANAVHLTAVLHIHPLLLQDVYAIIYQEIGCTVPQYTIMYQEISHHL